MPWKVPSLAAKLGGSHEVLLDETCLCFPRPGARLPPAACVPATGHRVYFSHEGQFPLPCAERASWEEAKKLSRNLETEALVHFFPLVSHLHFIVWFLCAGDCHEHAGEWDSLVRLMV